MNPDVAQQGEIDLETPAPTETPAVAETPVVEALAEAEAPITETPAETPAEPDKPKKRGLVDELIEERRERKALQQRLDQLSPVLNRLTPDVQQAIAEGRLQIQPPQSNADLERQRLETVAHELGLMVPGTSTPDIESARRVDRYVRGTVQAAVEPVRNMTLAEKATHNRNLAVAHAQQNGLPVDIIQQTYDEILAQPNGAQLLSQSEVAMTVWHQAIGRAWAQGKLTAAQQKQVQQTGSTPPPAVVMSEATGRRAPAAAVTLSPKLAQVYKDHGVDPAKAFSSKLPQNANLMGIELE